MDFLGSAILFLDVFLGRCQMRSPECEEDNDTCQEVGVSGPSFAADVAAGLSLFDRLVFLGNKDCHFISSVRLMACPLQVA